jgi:PAS domain S-box-containing protein
MVRKSTGRSKRSSGGSEDCIAPRPPDENERLAALKSYQILDTGPEAAFDDIARLASYICGTPIALISLVDRERQWFKARLGMDQDETHRNAAFCAHAILQNDIMVVPDAQADDRFVNNPWVVSEPNIRFYAGATLRSADGWNLGTLCVIDREPRVLTPEQIDALRTLSRSVITQLELRLRLEEPGIRESHSLLQAVVQGTRDSIYAKDAAGRYVMVNEACARIMSSPVEEILGRKIEDFREPELVQIIKEFDRRVLETGEIITSEDVISIDGVEQTYSSIRAPYRDVMGAIIGVVGVSHNITERKQSEVVLQKIRQELEERVAERTTALLAANKAYEAELAERKQAEQAVRLSHGLLLAVAEGTTDAVYVKDLDGRYLMINQAGAVMLGMTVEEVIGKDDFNVFEPETARATRKRDQKILSSGKAMTFESEDTAAGVTRLFHSTKAPYRDQDGNILGLIGISRDITHNKQAQEALTASEARYRSLFEINPLPTWVYDVETQRFLDVNDAAIRSYGYSRTEFLDMNIHEIRPLSERGKIEEYLSGRTNPEGVSSTWRHRKKDGAVIDVDIIWRPLQFNGRAAKMVVAYDVTERERAEVQLRELTEDLTRSNRALSDFASVASHDLQEPLRKIQTFGDRLKKKCGNSLPTEGQDYLDRMQNAAGRMQTLINDLLAFSRLTTRAQPFILTNIDEVARAVVSDLEDLISRTGGSVEINPLPSVYADPSQMRQLLQNLIGNALKFHNEGVTPVVHISAEFLLGEGVPCWRINIADNGIGFDEKYAERIFGVFERLHSRNEYDGTGIGLAICRTIVRRHGGDIMVVSAPGEGSTFSVVLPVQQQRTTGTEGAA